MDADKIAEAIRSLLAVEAMIGVALAIIGIFAAGYIEEIRNELRKLNSRKDSKEDQDGKA